MAQRPVERERRRLGRALGPLREDDLERVALPDVLLARRDARLVLGLGREALCGRGDEPLARRARRVVGERPRDLAGIAVEDLSDAAHVIEAHEHVGCDEAALRQTATRGRKRHGRLELRDEVVGEVADDRLGRAFGLLVGEEPGARADERVAAKASLFDRFEQEARAPALAQAEVCPEWGEEIGVEHGCGRGFGQEKRPSRVFVRAVTGFLAPFSDAGSRPARAPGPPVGRGARGRSHPEERSLASGCAQELEHEQLPAVLDRRDAPVEALARLELAVGPDGQPDEVAEPPGAGSEERRRPEQPPARQPDADAVLELGHALNVTPVTWESVTHL